LKNVLKVFKVKKGQHLDENQIVELRSHEKVERLQILRSKKGQKLKKVGKSTNCIASS
jgi:hypothetical protein